MGFVWPFSGRTVVNCDSSFINNNTTTTTTNNNNENINNNNLNNKNSSDANDTNNNKFKHRSYNSPNSPWPGADCFFDSGAFWRRCQGGPRRVGCWGVSPHTRLAPTMVISEKNPWNPGIRPFIGTITSHLTSRGPPCSFRILEGQNWWHGCQKVGL